ncbi:MAG: molybdopterin-dependent oxidoreductase [Paraburkholderia sp.]|nr:molybdopterin-dependent oxidoreductase [Paraburkholderia sp.]
MAAAPASRPALAASNGSLQLDVNGEVRVTNNAAHNAYHFGAAALLKLPAHSIVTSTTWTPRSTFTGPLLSDVLSTVGAYGSQIEIHTIDDYTCVVPVADAVRYGAVLAYEMNGKRLKVSNFGPLFLIYPRDQFPLELDGAAGDAKFAWQIVSMTIKQ